LWENITVDVKCQINFSSFTLLLLFATVLHLMSCNHMNTVQEERNDQHGLHFLKKIPTFAVPYHILISHCHHHHYHTHQSLSSSSSSSSSSALQPWVGLGLLSSHCQCWQISYICFSLFGMPYGHHYTRCAWYEYDMYYVNLAVPQSVLMFLTISNLSFS
jgi:hypothetical protein